MSLILPALAPIEKEVIFMFCFYTDFLDVYKSAIKIVLLFVYVTPLLPEFFIFS